MRSIKNMSSGERVKTDDVTSKYDGMSEGELMSELMRNVSASKNNGTFSEAQLDEFVSFVSPSLDETQRKRLVELVAMIKGR